MADHDATEGMHKQSLGAMDESFSFGALLDKFFQNSPLGKDLATSQQGTVDLKSQDLFVKKTADSIQKRLK